MSRVVHRRRFVPLLAADDYQSVAPNPPGDGDGDGDPPNEEPVDLCAVEIVNGGGDTFDCYDDSVLVTSLPDESNGWDGAWALANGSRYVSYDDFDGYTTGSDFGDLDQNDEWDGAWVTNVVDQETMGLIWSIVGLGGASNLTQLTGSVPSIGSIPEGSEVFIGIMHRSPIVSGLDGWTLVETLNINATAFSVVQYNSVYKIAASAAPSSVTVGQQSSGRLMFVLGVICPTSGTLTVSSDSRTYQANANPGGHPLVNLTADTDGTLAVHFSSCALGSTSTVSWTLSAGWNAVAGINDPNNRYAVGFTRLDASENTGEGPWVHPYSGEHYGAEITMLVKG